MNSLVIIDTPFLTHTTCITMCMYVLIEESFAYYGKKAKEAYGILVTIMNIFISHDVMIYDTSLCHSLCELWHIMPASISYCKSA